MKKVQMIMATSHLDLHGDIISKAALESLAHELKTYYIPMNINHDIRYPPIGRVINAQVIELPDGEYALQGIGELFEPSDKLESLAGDGRRIPIRSENVQRFSVSYDQNFNAVEDLELLRKLEELSEEESKQTLKKALEPIQVLLIFFGVFALSAIGHGFFRKLGSDIYDKLKRSLIDYFQKKAKRKPILDFCASVKHHEKIFEVHILINDPSVTDINDLLSTKFGGIDSLVSSLPLDDIDFARLVLEYKNKALSICYAVRSDAVPLMFRKREEHRDV